MGLGQSDWTGRSEALGQENMSTAGFLSTQPQGRQPSKVQRDHSAE